MIYGEEKTKEMSRSILPSRSRVGAKKERQRISRGARRISKMILKTSDFEEDDDLEEIDLSRNRDIHDMVFLRRDGDKISPIMRWARNIVKDVPKENRTTFMAAKLPNNLIGWHALGHIKGQEEFPRNELQYNGGYWRRNYPLPKIPPMSLEVFLKKIDQDFRLLNLLNQTFLFSNDLVFPIMTMGVEKKKLKEILVDLDGKKTEVYESYFVNEKLDYSLHLFCSQMRGHHSFLEDLKRLVQIKKDPKLAPRIHENEIVEKLKKRNPKLKIKAEDRWHSYSDMRKLNNFNIFASLYFDNFGDLQKIKKGVWPNWWDLSWKFKELS